LIINLSIILFLGFCFSYPLFLLITPQRNIKVNFFHFNLGLSIIVGSFGLLIDVFANFFKTKEFDLFYGLNGGYFLLIILFSIITWYYWEKNYPIKLIVLISLSGLCLLIYSFYNLNLTSLFEFIHILTSILGILTLSSVMFSMILGHWYLNIPNLPVRLIKNSVLFLNYLLFSRLFFNIIIITFTKVDSSLHGQISFFNYLQSFEGIMLWVGILFGIVGAVIINILTIKTINLQSIQSATGLLYVNLVMILIGEMVFKYFMIQNNIFL